MTEATRLETERLVLRPPTVADLGPLHEVWGDRDVMRWVGAGDAFARDVDESARRLERLLVHQDAHGFGLWAVAERDSGTVLGDAGLGWFPVIGLHDKDASEFGPWRYAWDACTHAVLPVITLSYGGVAYLSRQMRAGTLEVMAHDYVRTARAMGLSEARVMWKHAFKNALLPVITLFASLLPALIGGSVIVETVFALPGLGTLFVDAVFQRDVPVIMGMTLLSAAATLAGIVVADLAYAVFDPRIRRG